MINSSMTTYMAPPIQAAIGKPIGSRGTSAIMLTGDGAGGTGTAGRAGAALVAAG